MRTDVTAATCPHCYAAVLRQTGGVAGMRRLMEGITEGEGRDARVRYVAHTCDPVILAQYAQAAAMHRYADAVGAILDARTTAPAPQPAQPVVSRGAVARGWERMRRPAGTPEEPAAPAEPSGVDDGLLTDRLSI